MSIADRGVDLSPLDPENDPDRIERVVGKVMKRIGSGTALATPTLMEQIEYAYAGWFRPVFAAASVIAVAAGLQLFRGQEAREDASSIAATPAQVPSPWTSWIATGRAPSTEDLLFSPVAEDQ